MVGKNSPAPVVGFIYVPAGDDGPMAEARPGTEIRNPHRGTPWIVVENELSSMIASDWPGRLWLVEVTDPATREDQASVGGGPLGPGPTTRAVAVRFEKELPASMLFGEHGEAVCAVINAAQQLTLEHANKLSAGRHPDAARAYDRAFRTWLKSRGAPIRSWDNDFDGTLEVGRVRSRSPIYSGLMAVHSEVFKRAGALSGDAAYETSHKYENDVWLAEPWQGACTALLDAALALGAPDMVGPADSQILMSAWASLQA